MPEPLHATFQQAGCMVGSDSFKIIRFWHFVTLCKKYLVLNPQWNCSRCGCGNWSSGSYHCRRPNNPIKLILEANRIMWDIKSPMPIMAYCPFLWILSVPWITKLWRITLRSNRGQLKGRWNTSPEWNSIPSAYHWSHLLPLRSCCILLRGKHHNWGPIHSTLKTRRAWVLHEREDIGDV